MRPGGYGRWDNDTVCLDRTNAAVNAAVDVAVNATVNATVSAATVTLHGGGCSTGTA